MKKKANYTPKSPEQKGSASPGFLGSRLPIRIEDLLHARVVEIERIEFKAGWNPDPILRTLCAFANDFENLGGGYLVIGQDLKDGQPVCTRLRLIGLTSRARTAARDLSGVR